ncbi:MAG: ABC transporter ATP-binding protein [Syntrophomonadaceae bacterium]|nr:ABC transporter ATP-binding protein [Syntrophomonadaceae bacterium]
MLASTNEKYKFSLNNISHSFNASQVESIEVLRNINFNVYEHEFLALIGPSGCGKSTLLNIMSRLITPNYGEVLLDGRPLRYITTKIGYVSQADSLLPWRNLIDNVAIGLEIKGVGKRERRKKAKELIARAGLEGFEKSYPNELSGGMRKRADIIKVLAIDPEIIFMDEPFSALDVFTRQMLQDYILDIWQEIHKTIIFITHDLTEAITLADRILLMTARPATIKSEYNINLPRPRSSFDIMFEPQFIEIHKTIWNDLKEEIAITGEGDNQNF